MASSIDIYAVPFNEFVHVEECVTLTGDGTIQDNGDGNGLFLFMCGGSSDNQVTVKGGNGVFGGKDLAFTVQGGKYGIVRLDSGRFLQTTGANAGKIVVNSNGASILALTGK